MYVHVFIYVNMYIYIYIYRMYIHLFYIQWDYINCPLYMYIYMQRQSSTISSYFCTFLLAEFRRHWCTQMIGSTLGVGFKVHENMFYIQFQIISITGRVVNKYITVDTTNQRTMNKHLPMDGYNSSQDLLPKSVQGSETVSFCTAKSASMAQQKDLLGRLVAARWPEFYHHPFGL